MNRWQSYVYQASDKKKPLMDFHRQFAWFISMVNFITINHLYMNWNDKNNSNPFQAQSAGTLEYTDCISAKG